MWLMFALENDKKCTFVEITTLSNTFIYQQRDVKGIIWGGNTSPYLVSFNNSDHFKIFHLIVQVV